MYGPIKKIAEQDSHKTVECTIKAMLGTFNLSDFTRYKIESAKAIRIVKYVICPMLL